MNAFNVKLKLALLVPALATGLAALYTLLNWSLVEGSGLLAIDKDVADFWLPLAAGVVLALATVSPRLRDLALRSKPYVLLLYTAVALALVTGPALIAQDYLHNATGTLIRVADARDIASRPDGRYFKPAHACLDRARAAGDSRLDAGDDGDDVTVTAYVASPLCGGGDVWIGVIYRGEIDHRLSDAEKDARLKEMGRRWDAQFASYDPARAAYLERLRAGSEKKGFDGAFARMGAAAPHPVLVVARDEDFAAREGHGLVFLLASLIGGAALWAAMIAVARVDPAPHEEKQAPAGTQESTWRSLFLPTRANYGLPLLVDVNIAVYLAMALAGAGVMTVQSDDLIAWGGNYAPDLQGWGWLRLFTSQFVHAGAMHIINNMYGLLVAAIFLSPVTRNAGLMASYLLCGLGGSLASTWVHPDPVSVGASGAIFGLFGISLMLTLLGDAHFEKIRRPILLNAAAFVVINLVLGALTPGIDNAAHIGGLAMGFALGAAFFATGRRRT